MNYFDNGPMIKGLDELNINSTPNSSKTNSTKWIFLVGILVLGGSIYYWYNNKKKAE